MKPLERPSLQCIYCDDLRDEMGGKTTIVGWYGGESVPLPVDGLLSLPSLCVIGLLAMPMEPRFSSMKVELMQDDNVLQSASMPHHALSEMQEGSSQPDPSSCGRQIRVAVKLNNMQISDPCILRLRVVLDDEAIYGNGLRFTR